MAEVAANCSHCGSIGSVTEGMMQFQCVECGWWGPTPDKMIYEPGEDEDWRHGQVPPRPTE